MKAILVRAGLPWGLALPACLALPVIAADGADLARGGKLEVALTFEASGQRADASTGAYSRMTFSRSLKYVAVLRGAPDVTGSLHLTAKEEHGRNGRSCGRGTTTFLDTIEGAEYSGALVPFRREMRGGGAFPSGDSSVPERDLCLTLVSIDYARKVFHIRIDGSDSSVKVRAFENGTDSGRAFNLPLQGYDHDGSVKAKLIFRNIPLPADAGRGTVTEGKPIEGKRTIEGFNAVGGPNRSTFPLRATVEWRLTLD